MSQKVRTKPKAIKFLREDESPEIVERRIESDGPHDPPSGCYVIKMVVLEKPEPIRKATKKQR